MTALEIAQLDVEFHAAALQRSLGRGGAAVDLDLAALELVAVWGALAALATAIYVAPIYLDPPEWGLL